MIEEFDEHFPRLCSDKIAEARELNKYYNCITDIIFYYPFVVNDTGDFVLTEKGLLYYKYYGYFTFYSNGKIEKHAVSKDEEVNQENEQKGISEEVKK